MKNLAKNKFAKIFTAFLGVTAALTLLVTLISCEQANKASVVNQTDNNKLTPPPRTIRPILPRPQNTKLP